MNYYYDLLVNLQEEFYEFYEWEKKDEIVAIKKTPILRVNHKVLLDFLSKECTISENMVLHLAEKTISKNKKEKINGFLLTDTKNAIFLEFDVEGKIIYKSKLLVEDENNINEVSTAMKMDEIEYTSGKPLKVRKETRITTKEKQKIQAELNSLEQQKNQAKCQYLYYKWFHEVSSDMKENLKRMKNQVLIESPQNIHKIAHLIELTYKEQL